MAVPFDEVKARLAPEVREEGERRGQELIAKYLTLRELRKARKLSQKALAERFKIKQAAISKIERRNDLMLSTIRGYVEAAGGKLEMHVVFPNSSSVIVHIGESGEPRRVGIGVPRKRPASVRQKQERTVETAGRGKY